MIMSGNVTLCGYFIIGSLKTAKKMKCKKKKKKDKQQEENISSCTQVNGKRDKQATDDR